MHIPDGFLDTKTWTALAIVSGFSVIVASKIISKKIGEKQIPMMGVMAAFIFAAQMLNFPVAGGTSGHFGGGVLAAILLGPSMGLLVMTAVLVVQCLVFQDGGLTALGANIFNMGLIGAVLGYYLYILFKKINRIFAAFVAGFLALIIAASACSIELAISGTVPLKVALPAMVIVHILIGIGEGLITIAVLGFISKTRPDLLEVSGRSK